jgi:hypothetical protein
MFLRQQAASMLACDFFAANPAGASASPCGGVKIRSAPRKGLICRYAKFLALQVSVVDARAGLCNARSAVRARAAGSHADRVLVLHQRHARPRELMRTFVEELKRAQKPLEPISKERRRAKLCLSTFASAE